MTDSAKAEQRVLGVAGSPRAKGNSDLILETILKGVQSEGVASERVALRDYLFQPCIGCERCRKDKTCTGLNDGMQLLYPKILRSQGLVLISPTHNYNVTAWMKAFIDRLYCFYEFQNTLPRAWSSHLADQGRKAVIAAVCEQVDQKDMGFTLEAMQLPISALGYEIADQVAVFGHFGRGAVKGDADALERAFDAGRNLARAISV
jgi:multimeric flavodoxin WrbA